jgi:hypothetical protein
LLDDHGAPVEPEVWELLHDVIAAQGEISVLLEWDSEIPALDRVLDEADIARQVVARALVERDLLERAPARGAGQTGSVRP